MKSTINNDRLRFRFYHFADGIMYDVISYNVPFQDENFARVFINKPFKDNADLAEVQQMSLEDRAKNGYKLNWKSGIDGELMQCTGLKDKNKKLIYDGDMLINDDDFMLKILWDAENMCFKMNVYTLAEHSEDELLINSSTLKRSKIIGNIYENKDLLC